MEQQLLRNAVSFKMHDNILTGYHSKERRTALKIRLNDYDTKDVMRIIREWTEEDRASFGKSVKRSAHTIKNYEIGKSNYTVLLLQEIAKKHNLIITIEKKS